MTETDPLLDDIDELLAEEAYWREHYERNWELNAMRWNADLPEENPTEPMTEREWMGDAGALAPFVLVDVSGIVRVMNQVREAINRIDFGKLRRFVEHINNVMRKHPYDEHHPRPLAYAGQPFGADYARRRKARARRNR